MAGTSGKRQHAVNVVGIAGQWATLSGGESTVEMAKNWNGGAKVADLTYGRQEFGNVTVTRPFSATRDRPILRDLRKKQAAGWSTTITDQDLDANEMAIGTPEVFTGCRITSLPHPEFDTKASEGSEFSIEFMVEDIK